LYFNIELSISTCESTCCWLYIEFVITVSSGRFCNARLGTWKSTLWAQGIFEINETI